MTPKRLYIQLSPYLLPHKSNPPEHYGYVECLSCDLEEHQDVKFLQCSTMARHLLEHIRHGHHVQPATAAIALEADYEYPDE